MANKKVTHPAQGEKKSGTIATKINNEKEIRPALGKENIKFLAISGLIVLIGFALMAGGDKSADPNVFNYEIFSTTRIVIAPILVVTGFALGIYAILKKSE